MESLVLSPQDVENLEAMSDGSTGYFYKMLDYLEKRVEDGVRRGRFSEEAAKADLETALWYSYACNNLDEYESYCRAAQWMAASEGSAEAARCGMWYYRYSCALLYCGRLEEALAYAEKGVAVEPDYVWGWLQLGKLRSHFGDTAGALAAVERGLDLEPGDYEFTTLAWEIREGRSLEEMEYHWIDPEQDRRLQAGEAEEGEMADKRLAIACILCDRANLEAVKAALGVTEWEADAPYCTFTMPYGGDGTGPLFRQRGRPVQAVRGVGGGAGGPPARAGPAGQNLPGAEGGAADRRAGAGVVHHPAGPGATAVFPGGRAQPDGAVRGRLLFAGGGAARSGAARLRGEFSGLRAAGGAGVGPRGLQAGAAGPLGHSLHDRAGGWGGRGEHPGL